ncbi:hypothetical protein MJO28_007041 [Puccinia striiformis f. sp. tritici]|uniref:Uncharacterized protein n=1 Tax=Puccinia striiformis f. sp. tritici TaxID=168172 RepID=A0ACC0EG68_9BASI|nr:hypothetical protein Pst134EA_013141 [Puccinia striiformis f. sp. tritici]KAH9465250.1 hypothetical protein Pst134EA_013141 [Puccinia striiformis f. sp. tritici]KAI7951357.1 hypothetical protein MJO28_007041 [Puccinia striiformis f. sp. tritici]
MPTKRTDRDLPAEKRPVPSEKDAKIEIEDVSNPTPKDILPEPRVNPANNESQPEPVPTIVGSPLPSTHALMSDLDRLSRVFDDVREKRPKKSNRDQEQVKYYVPPDCDNSLGMELDVVEPVKRIADPRVTKGTNHPSKATVDPHVKQQIQHTNNTQDYYHQGARSRGTGMAPSDNHVNSATRG